MLETRDRRLPSPSLGLRHDLTLTTAGLDGIVRGARIRRRHVNTTSSRQFRPCSARG